MLRAASNDIINFYQDKWSTGSNFGVQGALSQCVLEITVFSYGTIRAKQYKVKRTNSWISALNPSSRRRSASSRIKTARSSKSTDIELRKWSIIRPGVATTISGIDLRADSCTWNKNVHHAILQLNIEKHKSIYKIYIYIYKKKRTWFAYYSYKYNRRHLLFFPKKIIFHIWSLQISHNFSFLKLNYCIHKFQEPNNNSKHERNSRIQKDRLSYIM